jgi:hypothetical protein
MRRQPPTLAPGLLLVLVVAVLAMHLAEQRRAQAVVDQLAQTGQSPPPPKAVSGGTLQAQEQWE